jgi:hypothetical protein
MRRCQLLGVTGPISRFFDPISRFFRRRLGSNSTSASSNPPGAASQSGLCRSFPPSGKRPDGSASYRPHRRSLRPKGRASPAPNRQFCGVSLLSRISNIQISRAETGLDSAETGSAEPCLICCCWGQANVGLGLPDTLSIWRGCAMSLLQQLADVGARYATDKESLISLSDLALPRRSHAFLREDRNPGWEK